METRVESCCLVRIRRSGGQEMTIDSEPRGSEEELFRVLCFWTDADPETIIVIVNRNQPERVAGSFLQVKQICRERFQRELEEVKTYETESGK